MNSKDTISKTWFVCTIDSVSQTYDTAWFSDSKLAEARFHDWVSAMIATNNTATIVEFGYSYDNNHPEIIYVFSGYKN